MGSRRLLIAPRARLDLLDIWEFIAEHSIPNADKVISRIESAFNDLRDMPGFGHERRDVMNKSIRFWSVHSYVIAYRFDQTSVVMLRVIHGSRNFRRLFDSRK